jgi:cephalosporin-C deacetylase-like acetyl esterase
MTVGHVNMSDHQITRIHHPLRIQRNKTSPASRASRFLLLPLLLLTMLRAQAGDHAIHKAATLPATTPWNLESLSQAPEFEWSEGKEVRSLYFKGEPLQGKPTRVFAYYATPGTLAGDPAKDKNLPGIVLIHGGGGKAFDGWARLWASRGFAAIAMDLAGKGADGKRLSDGGPDQSDETKFRADAPATDMWTYHAVAAAIRSHSLLRSFPEVDRKRTAVTGISWGGYLTCIVAGLDDRFQAAVPVYGCGYLHENSVWLPRFESMSADARATWIQLWDPSSYVGSARMPMLFVNGGTDFAYPPDSHAKTYALVKSPKNLHFVPNLKHGHIFDRPSAIEIFIRQCLEAGTPLARIAEPEVQGNRVTAKVETRTKLVKAQLHYTKYSLPGNNKPRVWTTQDAAIVENTIQADLPAEKPTIWFLTVEDQRQATVSSRLIIAGESGQ